MAIARWTVVSLQDRYTERFAYLFGLAGDGSLDMFGTFPEQVLLLQVAVQGQQPIHSGGMGFRSTVGKDTDNML